jgi:hypothetical protein
MENLYPQQIEVSNWKESGVVIWIILISLKLNYLVRDELTLTKDYLNIFKVKLFS